MRSVLTGLAILLMLGLTVGIALGFVFTRVFEAAQIDEMARNFSEPGAAAPVAPTTDNLRP